MKNELEKSGLSPEQILNMFDQARHRLNRPIGTLIFGTVNLDEEGHKRMMEMFYNSKAYKTIPFDNTWEDKDKNNIKGMFVPDYHIGIDPYTKNTTTTTENQTIIKTQK